MVASVVATLALIGLAHTFGLGRSFINRFEVARAGLAVAQQRLELLGVGSRSTAGFTTDSLHVRPFVYGEREVGAEIWRVDWYDDRATPVVHDDLKRVTVIVRWTLGADTDSVSLSRLFLPS